MAHASEQRVYEFGDFRIDADHRMLYHQGSEIPVVPKVVETLLALIERRGRIVSKDELLEAVWPNTVVEESNLFVYLSVLRKTLGTLQDGRPYVETLRRRGYRFNGDVHLVQADADEARVVVDFEQTETRAITKPRQIYFVKDWDHKPDSRETSYGSSAVPALKPVESSEENESVTAEVSTDTEISAEPLRQGEVARIELLGKAEGSKGSRLSYVIALSVVAILLSVTIAGLSYWRSRPATAANASIRTIAILPFRPLVNENRDEEFELGMADALITRLGHNGAIKVRPLNSVRNFSGPDRDPINAGKAVDTETVLDASIQRSGDRIRVNASLIRVADGTPIWADTFDAELGDRFVVQDAIVSKIVTALALNLTGEERTRVAKRYTNNPDAEDFYYRGRANELKITKEGLLKAIDFFDNAIKADPNYALAYAHKADAYRALFQAGFARDTEVLPQALLATQKALAIDETLAEALVQDAWLDILYKKDRTSAEITFKRAIALSPNAFDAHLGYAGFLSNTKQHEKAVDEARRARELSPMTPFLFARESQILLNAGKVEEAVLQAQKGLEIDQNFWVAHLHLGNAYLRQKRYDEAIAELEKATRLAPESWYPQMFLARSLVWKGDREKPYAIVRDWESRRSERFVPLSSLAMIYSGLGNRDKALDLLEKAAEEGEHLSPTMLDNPLLDNLRSEPRFQNILKRLNLDN